MQQEYDFLPFVFTETLYYIDEVDSEWKIPIQENVTQTLGKQLDTANTTGQTATHVPQLNQLKTQTKPTQTERLSYMGRNRKAFLILVEDTTHEFLAQHHSELLGAILRAGGLSLADVAIVNLDRSKISFVEMYELLKPNYVLNFGTDLSKLGISYQFEPYQPKTIKTITWLVTEDFEQLHQDKQKKFTLWQALKQLDCYKS